MVAVPAETPVTTPDESTIATEASEVDHGVVLSAVPEPVKLKVEPTDTLLPPVIAGEAVTVPETAIV